MYHLRCRPAAAISVSDRKRPKCEKEPQLTRRSHAKRTRWITLAVAPVLLLLAATVTIVTMDTRPAIREDLRPQPAAPKPRPALRPITKQDVQQLMAGVNLLNLTEGRIELRHGNACFTLQTTLDPDLQQALITRLDRKNSRYIGIVAMEPADGRVLAMAGYDRGNPNGNPCLDNRFPAASVFKIITAAAALEAGDLEPGAMLRFSGDKYTLYKSQITSKTPRNANQLSFKDSFAQSVNPVFGRLGANLLGKDVIEAYAEAFGFNREIDFELPLRPSRIELGDGAFELAEVASGYNRTTRISPLHGASMASAIVNHGRWVEPTVVDWISNDAGQTIYQSQTAYRDQTIDRDTARVLRQLMQATVQSGTAHKEFQKHHGDKVLSRLEIGGKTGSMGDGTGGTHFDWFVGYAREPQLSRQMVVAVVVAHEGYIGTRAAAYAVMAMKEYFQDSSGTLRTQVPPPPRS
jgi:cell division protein FtsI/penicillin-binding protein 2